MRYWSGQGRHQKIYNRLRDKLVPDVGNANTEAGEIIRVIGNVVYEVGNNGGCNFNGGRQLDLVKFLGLLKEIKFEKAESLYEQLAGLAEEVPTDHCSTCHCIDDFKQYPPLDERLLDEAVDLLVIQANKLDKRKAEVAVSL